MYSVNTEIIATKTYLIKIKIKIKDWLDQFDALLWIYASQKEKEKEKKSNLARHVLYVYCSFVSVSNTYCTTVLAYIQILKHIVYHAVL